MKNQSNAQSLAGFLLLPPSSVLNYRGVDRNPFLPLIFLEEMDPQAQIRADEWRTWVLYPPGWRREAYRLYEENSVTYEENSVPGIWWDSMLLSSIEVAKEIQQIIKPYLGYYEIIACKVGSLQNPPLLNEPIQSKFLGYDIAYPGGDFYSVILNGLLVNPSPMLVNEFKHLLNESGLFWSTEPILPYLHRFREEVLSEARADFVVFKLAHEDR